ncbi:MAG TPA: hypothetical protein VFY06_05825, partial [Verrucomicrobiae bacterium]|nr:hypothetical protein [Verrucomicrobiae bacterium]
ADEELTVKRVPAAPVSVAPTGRCARPPGGIVSFFRALGVFGGTPNTTRETRVPPQKQLRGSG